MDDQSVLPRGGHRRTHPRGQRKRARSEDSPVSAPIQKTSPAAAVAGGGGGSSFAPKPATTGKMGVPEKTLAADKVEQFRKKENKEKKEKKDGKAGKWNSRVSPE